MTTILRDEFSKEYGAVMCDSPPQRVFPKIGFEAR